MATSGSQGAGSGGSQQQNVDRQLEYDKLELEAWKKTIDVQQHFNDIEMRIRNIAVTVLAGVLGAAALALQGGYFVLVAFLLLAGLIAWLAFYFMDRFWYHQLLKGAVRHAEDIEARLESRIPSITLTRTISEASKVQLLGTTIHSNRRLTGFYWFIALLLILGSIISLTIGSTIFFYNLSMSTNMVTSPSTSAAAQSAPTSIIPPPIPSASPVISFPASPAGAPSTSAASSPEVPTASRLATPTR